MRKKEIHYLIAEEELVPSFAWNDYGIEHHWEPHPKDVKSLFLVPTLDEYEREIRDFYSGWLFLQSPRYTGPYKYSFSWASRKLIPKISEFDFSKDESWIQLLNTQSYGHDTVGEIDQEQIEYGAVFMIDGVEICENNHPDLKTRAESNQSQNTYEPINLDAQVDSTILGRREQQFEIILAVIAALGFEPSQIPDGGKSKIRAACLTRLRLFSPDSFDHAWKAGVSAGLFRLANHDKYSPN